MSDAKNNQSSRGNKEFDTRNVDVPSRGDLDLDAGANRAESLINIAGDLTHEQEYIAALAFMEELVTLRINTASQHSKHPETHVPVQVNGKSAEVLIKGKWLPIGWLPIGQELTIKRKCVEVLARSNPEDIATEHDGADVEKPRNVVKRTTTQKYPLSIIKDSQQGHEWMTRLLHNY